MARQIVLEVVHPYHKTGTEVAYQPGEQFPLGKTLPPDLRTREVIADVPDEPAAKADAPAKAEDKPAAKPAAAKTETSTATAKAPGR